MAERRGRQVAANGPVSLTRPAVTSMPSRPFLETPEERDTTRWPRRLHPRVCHRAFPEPILLSKPQRFSHSFNLVLSSVPKTWKLPLSFVPLHILANDVAFVETGTKGSRGDGSQHGLATPERHPGRPWGRWDLSPLLPLRFSRKTASLLPYRGEVPPRLSPCSSSRLNHSFLSAALRLSTTSAAEVKITGLSLPGVRKCQHYILPTLTHG